MHVYRASKRLSIQILKKKFQSFSFHYIFKNIIHSKNIFASKLTQI